MNGDLVWGVLALVLGTGLLLGHFSIARAFLERSREEREKPLTGAVWDYSQRSMPRWLRGERLLRFVHHAWLLIVTFAVLRIGVLLVARSL
jgi:hypothetical protein